MKRRLALTTLLVKDYNEAISFFVDSLGFDLIENTPLDDEGSKRWVVIKPSSSADSGILLAQASDSAQEARIGDQTSGRVFLFLNTDDFQRDYELFKSKGVEFMEQPRREPYGTIAVFRDISGNLWDLIGPNKD